MNASPLIEIEGLRVIFHGDDGRTTHAVDRSQRRVKRAVKTAKRDAKIAALSAGAARRLPG